MKDDLIRIAEHVKAISEIMERHDEILAVKIDNDGKNELHLFRGIHSLSDDLGIGIIRKKRDCKHYDTELSLYIGILKIFEIINSNEGGSNV